MNNFVAVDKNGCDRDRVNAMEAELTAHLDHLALLKRNVQEQLTITQSKLSSIPAEKEVIASVTTDQALIKANLEQIEKSVFEFRKVLKNTFRV